MCKPSSPLATKTGSEKSLKVNEGSNGPEVPKPLLTPDVLLWSRSPVMLDILDVPKPLRPRSPQISLLLEIPPRARKPILVSTTSKSTSNTVAVNKNRSDGSRVMKVRTKDSKGSPRSASMENAARRLGHFRSVSGVSASTRPRIAKSDDANASYHELASTSKEE